MLIANVTVLHAETKVKPFSRYPTIDDNGVKQYRFYDSRHTGSSLKFSHYHIRINGVSIKQHWTLWELIRYIF